MEKKINKIVTNYISNFKEDIKNIILDESKTNTDKLNFIFNYERLVFTEEDLTKRKRMKNEVSIENRCIGIKSNGTQCTRTKKNNIDFCGTHHKGTPHGIIDINNINIPQNIKTQKIEIWTQLIQGIIYYIDACNNIYLAQDIINKNSTPKIIGKYKKDDNGNFTCHDFTL
jgi:hypothetical protein